MKQDPIVLDIGTEAVRACNASGCFTQYFDQFGAPDFKKAISKAFEALQGSIDIKKTTVLLILPPNFLKARVVLQNYKRSNFKKNIDKIEEKEIFLVILKEARRIASKDFAKISGILPQDLEFLSQEILKMRINGYETSKLQGYKGKNLEFRVLFIFIPRYYLQNFEKIIKDLGIISFKIIHPAQSFSRVFEGEDAIFLDIGGEITQIFLIRNRTLEVVDEFEMGGKDFSSSLSQALGLNSEDVRDLKERYSKGALSENSRRKLKEIFSPVVKEWLLNLKTKLKTIKGLLPQTIFLSGGGSKFSEIEEVLSEDGWEVKYYEQNFGYYSAGYYSSGEN